jgi:phosphoribosyl 1,2-cyclic phosphate phosphodiesterase
MPGVTIDSFALGPFETNCLVVRDPADPARACWIVDPGAGPDPVVEFVRRERLVPERIVLTHAHADHIAGLDEMRAINRHMGSALPLYATEATLAELRSRFAYCFQPPTRGFYRPALDAREVAPGQVLRIGSLEVELLDQDHQHQQQLLLP